MNELIKAAKAVIEKWDLIKPEQVPAYIKELHAAVERAENPPADYNAWTAKNAGEVLSAHEVWTAAQQAERERIRARAKIAAEKVWRAGDWFIGPQDHILEKFVDALLEDDDE